jgi:HK97 family phage portal protein
VPIRETLARMFGAKASVIGLEDGQLPDVALEKGIDDAALLSTLLDDPWPYFCIAKIAENAALAPLQFGTLDADGEFAWVGPDHPVQALWDHPNTLDDGPGFTQLLFTYLETVGHAPIEIVRPMRGRRITGPGWELNLVNPANWRIVANADATISGYVYLGTTDYKWLPEQMTYLRWPHPTNRWYGQGRLAAVRQEIMAEEYAAIRDRGFEKRLGVPPGILTSDMPLGEPTALELQRRWEQAVGGYRNAGKIAVLGSKTTYQAIAANARDAEWQEQRRARQDMIAMAVGISPVLMRMSEATFANANAARAELWEGTLQPRMSRVAAMLTNRLVPLLTDEPLVARFDFSDVKALNENEAEVVNIAVAMANTATATVAEVRSRMSLEPFGDERDEAILMPTTVEWSTDRAAAAEQAATASAALMERMQQAPPSETPPAEEPPPARPEPATRSKARRRDRETLLAPVRAGFAADLRQLFSAQRGALRQLGKAQPQDDDLVTRALEILSAVRWRERLIRIGRNPIEVSQMLGATEAAAMLGVSASFLVDASEEALASVLARSNNLPNLVNGTTIEDVASTLRDALAGGEDRAAINERLDRLFSGYEEWRVDRIARTETAYAYAQGSVGQMREAGISQVVISDGDGDEVCAAADGQTWTLDEYLHDPLGHPNCTREADPVLEDAYRSVKVPTSLERTLTQLVTRASQPVALHADGVTVNLPEQPARPLVRTVIDRDPTTNRIVGTHEELL